MKKRKSPILQAKRPAASIQANTNLLMTAYALHQQGRFDQAEKLYRLILRSQPKHLDALQLLARIALQRHDAVIALELFNRIVKIQPHDSGALCNRANILFELKHFEESLTSYDLALQSKPDDADAFCNRGTVLVALNRYADALENYNRAISLRPGYAEAFNGRGKVLSEMLKNEEALVSYNQALEFRADYLEALYNRGAALLALKRHLEALASYDSALTINPDHVGVLVSRGNILFELNRPEEAVASCDRALKIKPGHLDALCNRGNALVALNRPSEALASYDQAQKITPSHSGAQFNEALCRLRLGDFAPGWQKYEWRWHTVQTQRDYNQPLWLGETSLAGKTILLHAEQGLGDTLQFCRYAPMVSTLGAKVILGVQPALKTLCQSLAGVDLLLTEGEPQPTFDCHIPLLSLPLALGTRLDTIPAEVPYLHANPEKIAVWQEMLGPKETPRVGLAWSGNPGQKDDHNRSLSFSKLAGLFEAPVEFVCLQKDFRDQAEEQACRQSGLRIFNEQLDDFADTAALIMTLDLVITVCTSIAHLAGALGKPVWIMLPFVPHFIWLLERNDSPWYPSARLFRQQKIGQWEAVLAEVGVELEKMHKAK